MSMVRCAECEKWHDADAVDDLVWSNDEVYCFECAIDLGDEMFKEEEDE